MKPIKVTFPDHVVRILDQLVLEEGQHAPHKVTRATVLGRLVVSAGTKKIPVGPVISPTEPRRGPGKPLIGTPARSAYDAPAADRIDPNQCLDCGQTWSNPAEAARCNCGNP